MKDLEEQEQNNYLYFIKTFALIFLIIITVEFTFYSAGFVNGFLDAGDDLEIDFETIKIIIKEIFIYFPSYIFELSIILQKIILTFLITSYIQLVSRK